MADAPQLSPPGVEIIQEFLASTPTILTPAMQACIVGPCRQIVEAVLDTGALNSAAVLQTPARITTPFLSDPFEYTGIGGNDLVLKINNGAAQTFTMPGTNPTCQEVVDAILGAGVAGITAYVETSGTQKRVVIETTSKGDNAKLQVDSATHSSVRTAFSVTVGYTFHGLSGYANVEKMRLLLADYPDPRDNMVDLAIDYDALRVFLNPGDGSAFEALRTEGLLLGATAGVTVSDDSDGDNLSPYLTFSGANFRKTAAVLTGTVDITATVGSFGTKTLILKIDYSGSNVTVTFANPADAAAVVAAINSAAGATIASLSGTNRIVLTSTTTGVGSCIERVGGTLEEANIGLAVGAYAVGRASKARAKGTVDLTGLTYSTAVQGYVLVMSLNGEPFQTLTSAAADAAAFVAEINALWGTGVAALDGANKLSLTAPTTFGGIETEIRIDKTLSSSALLTNIGLTTSGAPFETTDYVRGNPMPPKVGDEVWVDGVRLGLITEIPTTPVTRLRLDTEQLLTFSGSMYTIVAKGMDNASTTVDRPSSNLIVDENSGTVTVRHDIFHTPAGAPVNVRGLAAYLGYTALRRDVTSAKADDNFNLVRSGSLSDLRDQLEPVNTDNPLAYGMYVAMLNAPGLEITGCGVSATTASAPEGTLEAYAEAFQFLESKSVYAIAPLTHSTDVGSLLKLHVLAMSEPDMMGERVGILNPSRPTRATSTLVASGTKGNVTGAPTDVVHTGLANLQSLLAAAGVPGPSYTEDDQVYLEFEDDINKYLIASVSGGDITINNGPLTENDDGFFLDGANTSVFASAIVDRPFSVKIRGAALTTRADEAVAYANIGRTFNSRRILVTAPDKAVASIDGLDTEVEGYYMAAALAGRKSAKAPQQPLTEDTLVGFKGVKGSSDRYSESELRVISAGGLWVFYVESGTDVVRTRQQLTSDISTTLTKEDSITQALDYGAYLLRNVLRNFAGRFNITTDLLDSLNMVVDGVRDLVLREKVYQEFNVSALAQDESQDDAISITLEIKPYRVANKIRVTMRIA